MEYSSATITIGGRTVAVVGTVQMEAHARALALAAEREHREVMRQHETSATITMKLDSSVADELLRQLYARANGFDRDTFELEEQLARRPMMVAPAPLPQRVRARPRLPRSTPAVRRLSWLVEGRGR